MKKRVFAIIGSASGNSANQKLIDNFIGCTQDALELIVYNSLKSLPHFDPELSADNPPPQIAALRKAIEEADGVLICTPEYVFSIPSGLKNAIEWCVATTVFQDKPCGLITAAADGKKGHEELQLLMKTLSATFTDETSLLVQGVKSKINSQGQVSDPKTKEDLEKFAKAFVALVNK